MELYQKDGITIQALTPREADEYKKLGFVKVPEPAAKKPTTAEKKVQEEKGGE